MEQVIANNPYEKLKFELHKTLERMPYFKKFKIDSVHMFGEKFLLTHRETKEKFIMIESYKYLRTNPYTVEKNEQLLREGNFVIHRSRNINQKTRITKNFSKYYITFSDNERNLKNQTIFNRTDFTNEEIQFVFTSLLDIQRELENHEESKNFYILSPENLSISLNQNSCILNTNFQNNGTPVFYRIQNFSEVSLRIFAIIYTTMMYKVKYYNTTLRQEVDKFVNMFYNEDNDFFSNDNFFLSTLIQWFKDSRNKLRKINIPEDDKVFQYVFSLVDAISKHKSITKFPKVHSKYINQIPFYKKHLSKTSFQSKKFKVYTGTSQEGKALLESLNLVIKNTISSDNGIGIFEVSYKNENGIEQEKYIFKQIFISDVFDLIDAINEIEVHNALSKTIVNENSKFVKLYDYGITNNSCYLLMEYVKGGSVNNIFKYNGILNDHDARILFRECLRALEDIHSKGIVHGDIHVENILLEDFNNFRKIKFIDFGQSKNMNDPRVVSKIDYFLPEFVRNEKVYNYYINNPEFAFPNLASPQGDIFRLGYLFYFLLTSERPYCWKSSEVYEDVKNKNAKSKDFFNIVVSDDLRDLVFRMMDANPETRITIKQIWKHPFFSKPNKKNNILNVLNDTIESIDDNNKRFALKRRLKNYNKLHPIKDSIPKQVIYFSLTIIQNTLNSNSIQKINLLRKCYNVKLIVPNLGFQSINSDWISEGINWIKENFKGDFYNNFVAINDLSLLKGQWLIVEKHKYQSENFGINSSENESLPGKVIIFENWQQIVNMFLN